jgi:hypothetical protein
MPKSPKKTYPTLEQLRANVEAAKIVAMDSFERDWGTRDPKVVFEALRQTIPTSANPADAARKARALLD